MSKKEKENESSKTVKKETMWIVALIAVIVGFLGGVVFGIYKSDTGKPFQSAMVSQPAEKNRRFQQIKPPKFLSLKK